MKLNYKTICTLISAILIAGCANNTASWMQNSSSSIGHKRIMDLTLPGSYIANAYGIDKDGTLCKGEALPQSYSSNAQMQMQLNNESSGSDRQSLFLDQLNTQDSSIEKQLLKGSRYLDLQICQQSNEFYTANLYLTDKFPVIAEQISTFLTAHPDEIIILDFDNNLRSESGYMNQAEIAKFHDYLNKTFPQQIAPKNKMFSTIAELQKMHYQIIILSSNPAFTFYPDIWDKNQVANTADAQSATIKKLSLLEGVLGGNPPPPAGKLNILPIYSDMQLNDLGEDSEDNEADQAILMNYLQQNIGNRPGVIVANKTNIAPLENLIIQQGINDNSSPAVQAAATLPLSVPVIAESSVAMQAESISLMRESIPFHSESAITVPAIHESGAIVLNPLITLHPKIGITQ